MILGKLQREHVWRRIAVERLTEPLHLNLVAAFVALFAPYRTKVAFDLILRQPYAYGVLRAADLAAAAGFGSVTVIECGVGAGTGLLNLGKVAARTRGATGIEVKVVGFDTGKGLPPPADYRDHPEMYQGGDFPMDIDEVRRALPENTRLVLGPLSETVPKFIEQLETGSPIGFVAVDVDYYSSAVDSLALLTHPDSNRYLALPMIYLDDISNEGHNSWCGELLAVAEFNSANKLRKIEQDRFLETRRLFKNARWLRNTYLLHVLDHPSAQRLKVSRPVYDPGNSYWAGENRKRSEIQ